jgi:hypothetical protein
MKRRRSRTLDGRVRRLEAAWPVGGCGECENPVRLAWPGREAPGRCPGCGRELIVVKLAFDPSEESATAD